jgi:hypothetical protein
MSDYFLIKTGLQINIFLQCLLVFFKNTPLGLSEETWIGVANVNRIPVYADDVNFCEEQMLSRKYRTENGPDVSS